MGESLGGVLLGGRPGAHHAHLDVRFPAPGDEREAEGLGAGPGVHGEGNLLALGQVRGGDEDPRAAAHRDELDARLAWREPRDAGGQLCLELEERGHAGCQVQRQRWHLSGPGGDHERAPAERGRIEPFPGGGWEGEEEEEEQPRTRTHARPPRAGVHGRGSPCAEASGNHLSRHPGATDSEDCVPVCRRRSSGGRSGLVLFNR